MNQKAQLKGFSYFDLFREYGWEVGHLSTSQLDLYFVQTIEQKFNNVKLQQMLKYGIRQYQHAKGGGYV